MSRLIGSTKEDKVKQMFFSYESKAIIQYYIKKKVFISTNILIDTQSEAELENVMRDIYNTYASGRLYEPLKKDEVGFLQVQTIIHCVKTILPNLNFHIAYLNFQQDNAVKNIDYIKVLTPTGTKGNDSAKNNTNLR